MGAAGGEEGEAVLESLVDHRAKPPAAALVGADEVQEALMLLGRLGHAVDIGPEGVGFLADRPLRPGSLLALQMLEGAPSASLTRVARVVHCAPAGAGRWHVGCAVSPPFSPAELAALA